jgi:hypothetical protein
MKSLMEEASSISKAIENAWNRAGNPQEFSIKILELPKTSFFGLKTAKSAKVALFFNDAVLKIKEPGTRQARPAQQGRPAPRATEHPDARAAQGQQRRPLAQPQQRAERTPESRHNAPRQDTRSFQRPERQERSQEGRPDQRRPERPSYQRSQERESWSPEMVDAAQEWLKETLVLMGKPDIQVSSNVSHNYLKLFLSSPVMEDSKQEDIQLKSWGSLAMEAVREKSNKPLRNLRIVLESKR